MEIDYNELKKTVERARFEYGEELNYLGTSFLLFPCDYSEREKREGASPVFYQPSQLADWDIYFSVNVVDKEIRKPVLLHEILEAYLCGLGENEDFAHKTASDFDSRYAEETLNLEHYKKYCEFKNKWQSNLQ